MKTARGTLETGREKKAVGGKWEGDSTEKGDRKVGEGTFTWMMDEVMKAQPSHHTGGSGLLLLSLASLAPAQ